MHFKVFFYTLSFFMIMPNLEAQVKKKIQFYELDIIKGLYYQPNTIDPYTGLGFQEYPNGKKQMEVQIKDGRVHGKVKEWGRSGKKVFEAEYVNGVQVGKEEQWYSDGFNKILVYYENGKPHGTCTEWHQTGGKKSLGEYVNGKEEGEHNWWFATGKKDQTVNFRQGKEHGPMAAWHENGVQKIEANYNNGKLEGDYNLWYSNGQKKAAKKFRDSLHIGEALFWATDGRLTGKDIYNDNGVLIESYNYNSGSIKNNTVHYTQVFNTNKAHFLVDMDADDRISFIDGADDITYSMDGMLLQLFTFPVGKMNNEAPNEIFKSFLIEEEKFIEKNIESNIEINQEAKRSKSGNNFYYWHFISPSSKLPEQKPRTVQSEHYVTFICGDQILSLYSVVTNSDETETVRNMLFKVADTFLCQDDPIDLNEVKRSRK